LSVAQCCKTNGRTNLRDQRSRLYDFIEKTRPWRRLSYGNWCTREGMAILTPEVVTRLWDEHGAALVLYAQQWCQTPQDAVQEAFLMLVRQAVPPENPVGWLYRVVRNQAVSAARSSGRKSRREAVAAARGEPWFLASPSDRLDAAEAADALQRLPLEQREAIVARLWGGLSFEEIARIGGRSLSKTYRNYRQGIDALREELGWRDADRESEGDLWPKTKSMMKR
jgi:RNA polymerase sigma factor (sigma-70 family)